MAQLPDVVRVLHRSDRRIYLLFERVQVGVRLPAPANAGAALLQATGSAGHLAVLRAHAGATPWRLGRNGLRAADGTPRPAATEEEIYAALGLPFIPAEIRNGADEIQAAVERCAAGAASPAATSAAISTCTPPSATAAIRSRTMVEMCRSLGYEYIAITDHSPHSAASRNLSTETIAQQADEIARLREKYPEIAILHGCEVDILPDGRLDFPDRILERLDIVLASLHERAGHSPERLLHRYESAMKHPLVTLITHPTNRHGAEQTRLRPRLRPRSLRWRSRPARSWKSTARRPTSISMAPLARRAIAAGATLAVDSDCHRAELLDIQMELGVTTGAPRLGRTAARPEHAAARRHPRRRRRQTQRLMPRAPASSTLLAAVMVGALAFVLYRTTMLPGMDLGDTPSFQARIGTALLSPRDGYPLYTAIGGVVSLDHRRLVCARAEPRVGRRGGCGVRRPGAARGRARWIGDGGSRRRAALRRLVHLLEPIDHRRGLCAPHPLRRADACCSRCAGSARPTVGRLTILLATYAHRLRQSPVDDSARSRRWRCFCSPRRPADGAR